MKDLKQPLDKIKCKKCGKKVEILEVTGGGEKLKYAPCKCGCSNIISSEKWVRGPAEVDLTEDKEIIQYIRDLINLSSLLEKRDESKLTKEQQEQAAFDAELLIFIRQLRKAGYTEDAVHKYITLAGYGTRYGGVQFGEELGIKYELGCGGSVPRPIPTKGDQKEWMRLKARQN